MPELPMPEGPANRAIDLPSIPLVTITRSSDAKHSARPN
jgi:hypothetical protein